MKNVFVDAKKMAIENPTTFEVPTDEELNNLQIGDNVKVSTGEERFWVEIEIINLNEITGRVNNDLARTHIHGLRYDDVITFNKDNIYNII